MKFKNIIDNCKNPLEIHRDNRGIICDIFYKKKAYLFSKVKVQYKLTHEVPSEAADKIFMKIFKNYQSLKSQQKKELEKEIKSDLEVFIIEHLEEQDDFEIHILEIMKHF